MANSEKNFHEIALKSILFKGHSEWYFCFLKSEKIAHVLALLTAQTPIKDSDTLEELMATAVRIPHTVVHFVAGEADAAMVLADLFSAASLVRLSATQGLLSKENAQIVAQEYELVIRRIVAQSHPSPFVSQDDFALEEGVPQQDARASLTAGQLLFQPPAQEADGVKDIYKGHKSHINQKGQAPKEVASRTSLILDFVKKNKEVSIKDIAKAVRGCSEKTIQRELTQLINEGLIERRGERRWSVYRALPTRS